MQLQYESKSLYTTAFLQEFPIMVDLFLDSLSEVFPLWSEEVLELTLSLEVLINWLQFL